MFQLACVLASGKDMQGTASRVSLKILDNERCRPVGNALARSFKSLRLELEVSPGLARRIPSSSGGRPGMQ